MNNLKKIKNIGFITVERNLLVNINDVIINEPLSKEEHIHSYILKLTMLTLRSRNVLKRHLMNELGLKIFIIL